MALMTLLTRCVYILVLYKHDSKISNCPLVKSIFVFLTSVVIIMTIFDLVKMEKALITIN